MHKILLNLTVFHSSWRETLPSSSSTVSDIGRTSRIFSWSSWWVFILPTKGTFNLLKPWSAQGLDDNHLIWSSFSHPWSPSVGVVCSVCTLKPLPHATRPMLPGGQIERADFQGERRCCLGSWEPVSLSHTRMASAGDGGRDELTVKPLFPRDPSLAPWELPPLVAPSVPSSPCCALLRCLSIWLGVETFLGTVYHNQRGGSWEGKGRTFSTAFARSWCPLCYSGCPDEKPVSVWSLNISWPDLTWRSKGVFPCQGLINLCLRGQYILLLFQKFNNLTHQMGCFQNLNLSHLSSAWRAPRKRRGKNKTTWIDSSTKTGTTAASTVVSSAAARLTVASSSSSSSIGFFLYKASFPAFMSTQLKGSWLVQRATGYIHIHISIFSIFVLFVAFHLALHDFSSCFAASL